MPAGQTKFPGLIKIFFHTFFRLNSLQMLQDCQKIYADLIQFTGIVNMGVLYGVWGNLRWSGISDGQ